MGWDVFYGLKPLAQNNPLERTQASGNGTNEMVWNAKARDEGGRDGILKSERATAVTIAIIETFAKVRELKRELVELHKETD